MVTKYNVVRPKKYTSQGQEKTMWLNVGTITKFDSGSMILELNTSDQVYQIFEQKKKTNQNTENVPTVPSAPMPSEQFEPTTNPSATDKPAFDAF